MFLFVFLLACGKREDIDNDNSGNDNGDDHDKSLIGSTLPNLEEGYLDIHAINTGRGESTLLIFSDGTTMLVDVLYTSVQTQ